MIVSHIAAIAKNQVIGVDGDLPWRLPEDLKFFKNKTSGHMILMGRKTFESFPKPLPKRLHLVITRQKDYQVPDGVHVFQDIPSAMAFAKTQVNQWGDELFVIGGGEIYKQTLEHADRLYLTTLEKDYDGDATYPEFEDRFILCEKEDRFEPQAYSFCLYVPKTKS